MSNQRKQIILNEITFWKKNKLLPERYCNFLMKVVWKQCVTQYLIQQSGATT